MTALIVSAFVLVITLLITMARFGLRKFLGYAAAVDVVFTILMFFMFAGSFSGIVAAAFAGLFMTVMLHILRQTIGYDKLKFVRWYKLGWVHTQGKVERFAW